MKTVERDCLLGMLNIVDSEPFKACASLNPSLLGMLNIVDSEHEFVSITEARCLLGMLNIVDSERKWNDLRHWCAFARYVKYCR